MSPKLIMVLALFLAVDAVVVAVVMKRALARRVPGGNLDLGALMRYARAAHEETGRYLDANYSGDVATLPAAIPGLLDALDQRLRQDGATLDRAMLKQLAEQALVTRKAATASEVHAAVAAAT